MMADDARLEKLEPAVALPCVYMKIMTERSHPDNKDFQMLFKKYYAVRRAAAWRDVFFKLFAELPQRSMDDCSSDDGKPLVCQGNYDIESILEQLYGVEDAKGRQFVDLSFATKMIATADPTMPLYDSQVGAVLKAIKVPGWSRDGKSTVQRATSNYAVLKDFYSAAFDEGVGGECGKLYDSKMKECTCSVPPVKKMDFVLWALGSK